MTIPGLLPLEAGMIRVRNVCVRVITASDPAICRDRSNVSGSPDSTLNPVADADIHLQPRTVTGLPCSEGHACSADRVRPVDH